MNSIQLATTLVNPTGTGFLFDPHTGGENTAILRQSGASGQPALVRISRTLPKVAGTSQGVERSEVRLTEYITVGDLVLPCITYLGCQIPVPASAAQRTAQFTRTALLARDAVFQALVEKHVIPI
jgi:hypothetical protein